MTLFVTRGAIVAAVMVVAAGGILPIASAQDESNSLPQETAATPIADSPTFEELLRADLTERLDASRGASLPLRSGQRLRAKAGTKGNVLIGLPT